MTDYTWLPAEKRVTTPWKNGGGTTCEIAASPADAGFDTFAWRLSIAQVTEPGPFSLFPGVDRHLAVLEGRLELLLDGADDVLHLSPDEDPLVFAGDRAAVGRPVDHAVRDLNLMIRRDRCTGRLRRPRTPDFVTTAYVTILVARAPCLIHLGSTAGALDAHDAVAIRPGIRVRLADAPLLVAEIDPVAEPPNA